MNELDAVETAGVHRWANIPEDPLMSRVSLHVHCAYRSILGREWVRGFVRNHYDRLYFVESGTAVVGTPEREIRLRPGCCYLIAADQLHRHACAARVVLYWCHFLAELDGTNDLFRELAAPMEARPADATAYRALFRALVGAQTGRTPAAYLRRSALLAQLLLPHLEHAQRPAGAVAARRARFLPVLRHIEAHLGDALRVDELAAQLGLHAESFSRAFRGLFGEPPKAYIQHRRIRRAQELLCYSDLLAQEVGARCGFGDPYHFSKAFKHLAGLSPTEYRRRYRTPPEFGARGAERGLVRAGDSV